MEQNQTFSFSTLNRLCELCMIGKFSLMEIHKFNIGHTFKWGGGEARHIRTRITRWFCPGDFPAIICGFKKRWHNEIIGLHCYVMEQRIVNKRLFFSGGSELTKPNLIRKLITRCWKLLTSWRSCANYVKL